MKFKRKATKKFMKCPAGENYIFKNGVAIVPGMRFDRFPVKITLEEFKSFIIENRYENCKNWYGSAYGH